MEKKIKIQVRDLNLYYGQNHALDVYKRQLNRCMLDKVCQVKHYKMEGE